MVEPYLLLQEAMSVTPKRCPECGSEMEHKTKQDTIHFRGLSRTAPITAWWCDNCGEGVLDGDALTAREEVFDELQAEAMGAGSRGTSSDERESPSGSRRAGVSTCSEHVVEYHSGMPSPTPKQVIVMRTDLSMRKGKMIAQGAHASLKVILDLLAWSKEEPLPPWSASLEVDVPMFVWMTESFTKVCVGVGSEAELVAVYEAAKAAWLPCALIEDSGRTEFHGVVTKTCCAVGPAWPDDIDPITGHLKLL